MRRLSLIAMLMLTALPGGAGAQQGPNCYSDGTCMAPLEMRPFPQLAPGIRERQPSRDERLQRREPVAPVPAPKFEIPAPPEPAPPPSAPTLPRNYDLRAEAGNMVTLRGQSGQVLQGVTQGSLTTVRDGDNTIQTRIDPNGTVSVSSTNGASARGAVDANGILVLHNSDGSVTTCLPVGSITRCN